MLNRRAFAKITYAVLKLPHTEGRGTCPSEFAIEGVCCQSINLVPGDDYWVLLVLFFFAAMQLVKFPRDCPEVSQRRLFCFGSYSPLSMHMIALSFFLFSCPLVLVPCLGNFVGDQGVPAVPLSQGRSDFSDKITCPALPLY